MAAAKRSVIVINCAVWYPPQLCPWIPILVPSTHEFFFKNLSNVSLHWQLVLDGVENQSGIIEVTTSKSGSEFVHTVVLRNVTMTKGTGEFKLPTEFLLGRIEKKE